MDIIEQIQQGENSLLEFRQREHMYSLNGLDVL